MATIPVSVQPIIVVLVLYLVENTLEEDRHHDDIQHLSFMLRILNWASFPGVYQARN